MDNNHTWENEILYSDMSEYPPYEENINRARRAVSRNGINLFVFLLVANITAMVLISIIEVVFPLFNELLPDAAITEKLNKIHMLPQFNSISIGIVNIVAMYLIAFPIFMVLQIGFKRRKYKKDGMNASEFFSLIPISLLLMQIGDYIGTTLNSFISTIFDFNISNATIDTFENMPLWLSAIMVCVFAPIVEEFLFRRTVIGTLGRYGNIFAIVISAVAFGLFHGNLYQFFYSFLVGLILGYIFIKSGSWWLCVLMHAVMNFLGGVLPMFVEQITARYSLLGKLIEEGKEVNRIEMSLEKTAIIIYGVFSLVLFILGLVLAVIYIVKKRYKLENSPEIAIPKKSVCKVVYSNVGTILFLTFCTFSMALSLFVSLFTE